MTLPILRWDREKKKWIVSGDGKLLLKPEKKKSKRKRKETGVVCVMCDKEITQEQLDGGRRTFWNEGIANGKVIPKGWVHQECISFNLGLYEKSYQV